jgi:hypothetical protein
MWRKRGRPKNIDTGIDRGTSELQMKRKQNITTESLDLCLHKKIITPIEHASGMKLRWIYTLRFGAPSVQSKSLQMKLYTNKEYDEKFLQHAQKKYRNIMEILKEAQTHRIVTNICVFNEFPQFLASHKFRDSKREKFLHGMGLLAKELFGPQHTPN